MGGCDAPKTGTGNAPAMQTDASKVTAPSTSSVPTSDTYNLRGAPVQGATRRSEVTFEVQDAQLVMKVGELALAGVTSLKTQITEDLEILEVSDGLISNGRLNHVLDKSTNTVRVRLPDGTEQSESTEDNGTLHGRVETIELRGGQWKRILVGPAPTPSQARLLTGPPIDDAMYPTAVKVGESWTETGAELRRWLGSDVLSARGEVKSTLLAVESQQGEKVAVIESLGEIEATTVDDENNELKMTLGLQGKMRRSLDRGVDLEGSADGVVKVQGEVVQDGARMSMTMTGRYTMRLRGSLR